MQEGRKALHFKGAMQVVHPWRLKAGAAGMPWLALQLRSSRISPQHLCMSSPSRRSCWHVTRLSTQGVARPSWYHPLSSV